MQGEALWGLVAPERTLVLSYYCACRGRTAYLMGFQPLATDSAPSNILSAISALY